MIGVFVQTNEDSKWAKQRPVGYVICESGCWEWTGGRIGKGYGGATLKNGRSIQAHRMVWMKERGSIPDGMTLDHLCKNKVCVRPDHLEIVTSKENSLRGGNACAQNARKRSCKRGHPFTPENIIPLPRGYRRCRTCEEARNLQRTAWNRREVPQ